MCTWREPTSADCSYRWDDKPARRERSSSDGGGAGLLVLGLLVFGFFAALGSSSGASARASNELPLEPKPKLLDPPRRSRTKVIVVSSKPLVAKTLRPTTRRTPRQHAQVIPRKRNLPLFVAGSAAAAGIVVALGAVIASAIAGPTATPAPAASAAPVDSDALQRPHTVEASAQ